MADWRRGVLRAIGAKPTAANLRLLATWQRWEGGHTNNDARFNWLNTTSGPGRSINGVGVKAFDSFDTGIRYTAETLLNGRYDDIVKALRSGDPYAGHDMSRGLQVWVSGRPDGNPGYAQKVMGGGAVPKAALPAGGRGPTGNPGLAAPPPPPKFDFPDEFLYDIWGDLTPLFKDAFDSKTPRVPTGGGIVPKAEAAHATRSNGKGLMIPLHWQGTHVTDGLGWGKASAEDIMASPGTAVQAPMGGQVVYWHPHGAQGGGSMLIRLENGREFWLGHIANGVAPGTKFRRGDRIADISGDHPRPHLHVDSR